MRPLEPLFLAAEAAALGALALPGTSRGRWPLVLALLAVAAAGVHGAVEGPRWQLAPAYALAATLLIAAAARLRPSRAAVAISAVPLILSAALAAAFPVFRLPAPTGPWAIGTRAFHWVDEARSETFTPDAADRREVMVQVWYPARPAPGARTAPYVEDGRTLASLARLLRLPGFMLGHLDLVRTHAVPDAPAAGGPWPVLVFAHGRGGFRQHSTSLIEQLVSHGYAVAAVDHPFAASGVLFPDGRIVAMDDRMRERPFVAAHLPDLAADAAFALDRLAELNRRDARLAGRLDLDRAGVFGLSLGGETAAESCRADARWKACLMIDVWMPPAVAREGLAPPALWLSRDAATMRAEGWRAADIAETQDTMRAAFEASAGARYLVLAPGLYHQDFSDAPLMTPLARPLGFSGPVGAERARAVVDGVTLAFFDRHLKGLPAPALDRPAAGLVVERRSGSVRDTR
ncbi:MAG: alpha/beta hydrolase family protein [Pseudomonadota bacterium]